MSGDVQPRRRKDKKRRKDETSEPLPNQQPVPLITSTTVNDDLNIHVHHEEGTGGGICAKIVFFLLFAALAGLVGLIFMENRGLTELDAVDSESRFSYIFEGWVDSHDPNDHDEHHEALDAIDEHEDEHDEHEEPVSEENDQHEENASEIEEDDVASDEVDDATEEEDDEEEELKESEEEDDHDEGDDDNESQENISENVSEPEEQVDEVDEEEDNNIDDEDEEVEDNVTSKPESEEEDDNEVADDVDEDNNNDNKLASKEISEENDDDDEGFVEGKKDDDEEIENNVEKEADQSKEDIDDAPDENKENTSSVNVRADNEVVESESDKQSDDGDIKNVDDEKIKEDLDKAQEHIKNNAAYANKLFDAILQKYPFSPRSLYGKALSLDMLSDHKRSNQILNQALNVYMQLFNNAKNVSNALYLVAGERCIKRMRFIGQYKRAIEVHNLLIERFPNDPRHANDLAVTYLTMNRVYEARSLLKNILRRWPNDGFALVHFGFILKTVDNNLKDSVYYMKKGMATKAPGVLDGRFYFHLGDALARLGKTSDAIKLYEQGVENKVFRSKYQRSLYNVENLEGKAWWEKSDLPKYKRLVEALEDNWRDIRREGLAVLNEKGHFTDEAENLKDTGDWKQFELFARGQKNTLNCKKCPITCKIIQSVPDASGCKRGQTKFSVMHPNTHVWSHCGPTNCRLRMHLGLKVPPNTYLRVADEIRTWEEGKLLIFDDSFEHEVWHNGTEFRMVLIVDVWHPQLTSIEKSSLSPI